MASTLVKGKYVLCKVNDQDTVEVINDGAVFQKDGEIIDIGKYDSIKARYVADEEIGSDQHMVLPGLVDAHHGTGGLSMVLMGVPDDNLEPWVISALMEDRPVDRYLLTMYWIARLIEGGITTAMHLHFPRGPSFEESITGAFKAYLNGGIRVAFALAARNQNHFVYKDDEQFLGSLPSQLATKCRKYVDEIELSDKEYFTLVDRFFKEYGGNALPKVRILLGLAGPQWCSDELLIGIRQLADKHQTGIHAHMLESMYQKMYAFKRFGKSQVEHLNDIGFLGPGVSFAHCVWLTEKDIELFAQTGTSVCHNPSANLRLRSGIAPVNQMLERGVNVALGMDGYSLNDDGDMLQDLRLCANLHRTPGMGKPSPTPGQLVKMATVNGAKATLFSDQIGTLEKGKRADIIVVNLENITEPYLDPESDIVSVLLARGRASDIDAVMIDGEMVLRNRKHTKINKGEIVAALRESLSRALKPSDIERRQLGREVRPYVVEFYRNWQEPEARPYYVYNSA